MMSEMERAVQYAREQMAKELDELRAERDAWKRAFHDEHAARVALVERIAELDEGIVEIEK